MDDAGFEGLDDLVAVLDRHRNHAVVEDDLARLFGHGAEEEGGVAGAGGAAQGRRPARVLRQPIEASSEQVAALRKIHDGNVRPPQPLDGRLGS